jgi:hypothetical protein
VSVHAQRKAKKLKQSNTSRLSRGHINGDEKMKAMLITGAIIAALTMCMPAQSAEWPYSEFTTTSAVKKPHYRKRRVVRKRKTTRRRRPQVKSWRYRKPVVTAKTVNKGCKKEVIIGGDQAQSTKGARAQSIKSFAALVRSRHGELFMDIRNARDVRFRCVHSSIPNLANRATKAIGFDTQFERCTIRATPCMAPEV